MIKQLSPFQDSDEDTTLLDTDKTLTEDGVEKE